MKCMKKKDKDTNKQTKKEGRILEILLCIVDDVYG